MLNTSLPFTVQIESIFSRPARSAGENLLTLAIFAVRETSFPPWTVKPHFCWRESLSMSRVISSFTILMICITLLLSKRNGQRKTEQEGKGVTCPGQPQYLTPH